MIGRQIEWAFLSLFTVCAVGWFVTRASWLLGAAFVLAMPFTALNLWRRWNVLNG